MKTNNDIGANAGGARSSGIQVIARAAEILRALTTRAEGLSLGELAAATDLPRSTVQRIVDALLDEGLVISASATSGVRLGPVLLALAKATRFQIAELCRPTLDALADECGETIDLALFDQTRLIFIDQVIGRHRMTARSAVGTIYPLHSTANGKAMLAALDAREMAKLKKRLRLTAVTPNTITSWDRLSAELETVRRTGLAYDNEENTPGMGAVAVAFRTPFDELVAIAIPSPIDRFADSKAKLSQLLLTHCERLWSELRKR